MLKARQQDEDYARALPAAEGRPPFVVVVDVGHVIEMYAEFTRSGATYTPFPDPRSHRIRSLAGQLDAHRKARQEAHESVTLTGLYNVLEKLRRGEPLTAKDKTLHEQGLVSVLQSLHDELDAAVLEAYGWSDLGAVPWGDDSTRAAWT